MTMFSDSDTMLVTALLPRLESDCITANVPTGIMLKESVRVEKVIVLSQFKTG